jgi:hypothetical protein
LRGGWDEAGELSGVRPRVDGAGKNLTRTCSWRQEVLSGKVTIFPEGLPMYGIEPEDDASSVHFYFSRMHPKDRPEVEQAYAAALLRKTDFEADFQ